MPIKPRRRTPTFKKMPAPPPPPPPTPPRPAPHNRATRHNEIQPPRLEANVGHAPARQRKHTASVPGLQWLALIGQRLC
jgi:hypothetical protein